MSTTPTGWQTPKTDWNSNTGVTSTDFNRIEGNVNAIETGSRTVDPAQAPSGVSGTLRQFLDWLPNRIKALHGENDWWAAPAATIKAIWAKFHALTGHKHTGSENDAPKLPLSSLDTDVATQAELDTAMSNHLTAQDPHPQYATDTDLAAKVSKAGDTMTGDLILNGAQSKIRRPAGWATWARGFVFEKEDATTDAGVMAFGGSTGSAVDHIGIGFGATPWVGNPGLKVTPTGAFINDNTVWHAGNDGAGSGLDADMVDGVQTTSAGGTEANRLAVTDASGRVGAAVDALTLGGAVPVQGRGIFGDGSDGNVTISSNTALTRDMFYGNLTINAGVILNAAGYRIFVRGTLTNNGTIHNNGSNGTSSAGGTGGKAGSLAGGAAGEWAAAGNSATNSLGGAGGKGGGASGHAGGTATPPAADYGGFRALPAALLCHTLGGTRITGGAGGGGGYNGGGGGGGGGGLMIAANAIVNAGAIQAMGGTGGDETTTGGGGGGGGFIVLVYASKSGAGTVSVAGGAGGTGPSGNGEPGAAGTLIEIQA